MPSITALGVNSGMAGLTEGNQILSCVGAAFRQRFDVVDFLGFHIPVFLQTQFTQRMGGGITVADAFPGTTIPTLGFWVAVIFFIPLGFQFGVFLTEPAIGQLGTARVRAGAFGFTWPTCPPSFEDV